MKGSQGDWLIRVFGVAGINPVDNFFDQLLRDDPQALLEFTGFLAPILVAYGPDAGDPPVEFEPSTQSGWIRWLGDTHSYRIKFSIDEKQRCMLLLDADSSSYNSREES